MNKIKYPSPYEIQEVVNSFLKRTFIDNFTHGMGIFLMNAKQEEVAKELSHIIFDREDINILRMNAYQATSKHALSGFTLTSSNKDFSLQDLYEKARDNDKALLSKGYRLNSLIKISKEPDCSVYKGSIEYKKKKPGRIELLDEETGYSEFYFVDKGNGEWQVEVDGNKSNDGKEVQKLISGITDKNTTNVLDVNISALKSKNTIEFFDALAKVGIGESWRFADVKHLAFKRGKVDEKDEDEEEEEESVVEREHLTGIRQAILDGRNLREDPFVLQYEKEGCIFSAMTYEFENSKAPETIQIKAEFKGNPKIFEVSIISYKITKDLDPKKETVTLPPDRHRELRSLFWNNAKTVYYELIGKS